MGDRGSHGNYGYDLFGLPTPKRTHVPEPTRVPERTNVPDPAWNRKRQVQLPAQIASYLDACDYRSAIHYTRQYVNVLAESLNAGLTTPHEAESVPSSVGKAIIVAGLLEDRAALLEMQTICKNSSLVNIGQRVSHAQRWARLARLVYERAHEDPELLQAELKREFGNEYSTDLFTQMEEVGRITRIRVGRSYRITPSSRWRLTRARS